MLCYECEYSEFCELNGICNGSPNCDMLLEIKETMIPDITKQVFEEIEIGKKVLKECEECKGSGKTPEGKECEECNGKGKTSVTSFLYVEGKMFHCDCCDCNIFTKYENEVFKCNCCDSIYQGS